MLPHLLNAIWGDNGSCTIQAQPQSFTQAQGIKLHQGYKFTQDYIRDTNSLRANQKYKLPQGIQKYIFLQITAAAGGATAHTHQSARIATALGARIAQTAARQLHTRRGKKKTYNNKKMISKDPELTS